MLASVVLLAVLLLVLFHKSFESGQVFFSNDGPLGQMMARQDHLPAAVTGYWQDLNTIGISAGSASANVSSAIKSFWETLLPDPYGPLCFSNTYTPISLFILGLGALVFFYQLKLSPLAALLGTLATMLNSTYFGGACWGIAGMEIAMGFNFFALALVMVNTSETPWLICWIRFALAGLCVGMNVMETPDIGALASMLIALFVFFKAFADEAGTPVEKTARSTGRVMLVAGFAMFIAVQTVLSVVGTAITGVAGMAQDSASKAANWDRATQWSLPKAETFSLFVPGLFGYKMDTPTDMPASLENAYRGGLYWGGMGRDPLDDRFLDSGAEGSMPDPMWLRQTGNGNYCGIFVGLIGLWTIAQSFRRQNSLFSEGQKRIIWFWTVILILSLLFAWGRFAPFYAILYKLPYFSTIRNPTKFIIFFSWALIIVFGYGVDALSRGWLSPAAKTLGPREGWQSTATFDRGWIFASAGIFGVSLLGWWIYASHKAALIKYLQKVGFADADLAGQIAGFSISQAGWFVVLLAIAIVLLLLVVLGVFGGSRAKIAGALLVGFMLFDFVRADLPYIIHWNYFYKYEVKSLNPVETFLMDKPYEHRVAILPFDPQSDLRGYDNTFGGQGGLYRIEWAQQHFPYYNIQSLDIIQMPRMPEDLADYLGAFTPRSMADVPLYTRLWQLTNTRYLLGATGFINILNQQLDPGKERFRIAQRFDVIAKTNVTQPSVLEDLTADTSPDGDLAVIDFTGALPRAKLYSNWQVNTNDQSVLNTLANLSFDPAQTVLVSTPQKDLPPVATNDNTGTVEFKTYEPQDVVLDAKAVTPSVLLLNDKYDPHWHVTVDGQPAPVLRCNYIMRGVYLTPGEHTVRFHFSLPGAPLFVNLCALVVGFILCGILIVYRRRLKPQP
jgi:hypothetical protein